MPLYTGSRVWRLTLSAALQGGLMQNVFYFGSNDAGSNAHDLNAAFNAAWLPNIRDIQSDSVVYNNIESVGVKGVFDFDTFTLSVTGNVMASAEPKFVAWSYRLDRGAANERHGFKRFAGCPDSWWDGEEIDPLVLPTLDALATELNDNIAFSTPIYTPLIQRRFLNNAPVDPVEYYTYPTASFLGISTQNTRKT